MSKKNCHRVVLTATAIAAILTVAACGGGGSSSPAATATGTTGASGTSNAQTATSPNVSTPQYGSGSAQLAAFQLLNQERQQCGFSPLTENTTFDQAAVAHAAYMGESGGLITDTEVATNPGFTGVTYTDRAIHFGYPSGVLATGVDGGFYTYATLTQEQYGQQLVYDWLSGVYHVAIAVWPVTEVGVGFDQITFEGFPQIQASLEIGNLQTQMGNGPLTFPCQGTTGVAYSSGGERPTPPSTSGNFGTVQAVGGLRASDTIVLSSGTITNTATGAITNLNLLDLANDPNNLLPSFEGVAYPSSPLQPNTVYSVSITGTDNGVAFSRDYTFTTGDVVG